MGKHASRSDVTFLSPSFTSCAPKSPSSLCGVGHVESLQLKLENI